MKALFVHDHIFEARGEEVFSDKLPNKIWNRYLRVFPLITVAARSRSVKVTHMPLSSGDGVRFAFLPSLKSFERFFGARLHQQQLSKLVQSHDCVIARLPSEFGLIAAKVALEQRKPLLIEVVGSAWDAMWHYGTVAGKLYAPVYSSRTKFVISQAEWVSYVTHSHLQLQYPASNTANTSVLPNVELPEVGVEVLLKRLAKVQAEPKNVGLIGSFKTRYKGIQVAIEAVALAAKHGKTFHLRVLGDGAQDAYLKLAKKLGVEGQIYFDGVAPGPDHVFSWLDECDIYIQPSLTEGLPRALLEAMARGCPAVASSCGGIPELLSPEWLTGVGDGVSLADKLLVLAENADLRAEQAKRNFVLAQSYQKKLLDARRFQFLTRFALSRVSRH